MGEREFSEEEAHAILRRAISLKSSGLAKGIPQSELFEVAAEAGIEQEFVAAAILGPAAPTWSWTGENQLTIKGIDPARYQYKFVAYLESWRFLIGRMKSSPAGISFWLEHGFNLITVRLWRHEDEVVVTCFPVNQGGWLAGLLLLPTMMVVGFSINSPFFPTALGISVGAIALVAGLVSWSKASLRADMDKVRDALRRAIEDTIGSIPPGADRFRSP